MVNSSSFFGILLRQLSMTLPGVVRGVVKALLGAGVTNSSLPQPRVFVASPTGVMVSWSLDNLFESFFCLQFHFVFKNAVSRSLYVTVTLIFVRWIIPFLENGQAGTKWHESSLKPVTDAIPWAHESCNFWYSEGLPKLAVTAIVGLNYLSLHPSLFSVRWPNSIWFHFRGQVSGIG